MIETSGQVKVADFGIAQALTGNDQTQLTQAGAVMGTATYFSPEQAQGKQVDPRSDLYSLGCVLYEMLTARPPFTGDTPVAIAYKHVQETPPLPSERRRQRARRRSRPSTMKLLAKDPADRYATAEDLRADLRRFLDGQPVAAGPGRRARGRRRGRRRRRPSSPTPTPRTAAPAGRRRPPPAHRCADPYYDAAPQAGQRRVHRRCSCCCSSRSASRLFFLGSNISQEQPHRAGHGARPCVEPARRPGHEPGSRTPGFKVNERRRGRTTPSRPGIVFDQDPEGRAPASTRAPSSPSASARAPATVAVPDVVGRTRLDARRHARRPPGSPSTSQQQPDDDRAQGPGHLPDPAPTATAPKGSKVDHRRVVGQGRRSRSPSVAGESATERRQPPRPARLPDQPDRASSATTVPRGRVIRTNPPAGDQVDPKRSPSTIVVSAGPRDHHDGATDHDDAHHHDADHADHDHADHGAPTTADHRRRA